MSIYESYRGFTVIELMVVVALVAILATIAAPSFSTMIKHTRVKGAASDFHMALLKTRSEAVKRNTSVTMTHEAGGWAAGWRIEAGGTELGVQAQIEGVTIEDLGSNPDPDTITYLRSGRVDPDNVNRTYRINVQPAYSASVKAGRCRDVSIGPTGVPTVRKADCP